MPINGFYCCLHNEELDELKYLISIQKKYEEKPDIHFSKKNLIFISHLKIIH